MFRLALVALLASAVSAVKDITPGGDISLGSRLGRKLLSEATVITPARILEENERDETFIAGYSLRYTGCSSLTQVNVGNNNNNKNNEGEMIYVTHLAKFSLCPAASCGANCAGGGEYVMSLETFVDAFTEAKLNAQEYACEMVRENCYCDDANDDQVCESTCYANAGLSGCEDAEGDGDAFEVQRYLECKDVEFNKNNNNGNNNNNNNGEEVKYYVGPYCSSKDSWSIHLGVFLNEMCSVQTESSVYANELGYGVELPYSTSSLVDSECMACQQVDQNQNNNNNNNNVQVAEICEETYQVAARCEAKMEGVAYPDTSGCEFINNILPRLHASNKSVGSKISKSGKGAKAFAGIFAFTTVLFASYAYFLYRKIKRGSVDLSSQV